jgi:ABC-2 type transport system permease protein
MLYASIFLAVGSMCNTLKDAQNFMGPIMIVMIVPLLTMMFIAKDPNGTLAVVLSWIPVFTPFVMMNRAAASPPMFEVVGTTLLLAVSVVIVIWIAARIFRTGILRTGQPPKAVRSAALVARLTRGR